MEVDVSCFKCKGKGCNVCKHTGWIEILGAGMVHPNVLEMAGFDSNEYSALHSVWGRSYSNVKIRNRRHSSFLYK